MRMFKAVRSRFRLYFDLPSTIIILVILSFVYRPILGFFFRFLEKTDAELQLPVWVGDFGLAMLANLLSAIVIAFFVLLVLGWRRISAVCGTFDAYDLKDDNAKEPWGKVTIRYNLLSNKIRGSLIDDTRDTEIVLDAVFDRGQYLRGHYVERNNLQRRRLGAFLLLLGGDGDSYEGPYVFVDPHDTSMVPKTGRSRWERVP